VDASGSSPELLANGKGGKTGTTAAFSDEVGAPMACVVLCQGGKEEGAQSQVYPEKKAARGARGSAHRGVSHDGGGGRSSNARASSCPDGEKVVRGGSRLQSKTGGAATRERRRHDGLTGGGAERGRAARRARTAGTKASNSHGREVLRQRGGGAASDSGGFGPVTASTLRTAARSAGAFMARARRVAVSARCGAWHAGWRQHTDEWARRGEREADRWDPRQILFRIKNTPERK
jgi:hypothetical protein